MSSSHLVMLSFTEWASQLVAPAQNRLLGGPRPKAVTSNSWRPPTGCPSAESPNVQNHGASLKPRIPSEFLNELMGQEGANFINSSCMWTLVRVLPIPMDSHHFPGKIGLFGSRPAGNGHRTTGRCSVPEVTLGTVVTVLAIFLGKIMRNIDESWDGCPQFSKKLRWISSNDGPQRSLIFLNEKHDSAKIQQCAWNLSATWNVRTKI